MRPARSRRAGSPMPQRSRKPVWALPLALVVVALVVPAADARVLLRLNYETGNFRQWTALQALPGRAAIVRSPTRQGRFAARFVVRPGDDPIGSTGERSEVFAFTGEGEGSNSWWAWSTYFPRGFRPNPGTWNVFTQWHHTGPVCPPPVNFLVDGSARPARLLLHVRGGSLNPVTCEASFDRRWGFARLRRGRWYDFRFHVRWSSNPAGGLVALWVNGRRVLRRAGIPTLYPGQGVYVKQGFYRNDSGLVTAIVHDGLRLYRP